MIYSHCFGPDKKKNKVWFLIYCRSKYKKGHLETLAIKNQKKPDTNEPSFQLNSEVTIGLSIYLSLYLKIPSFPENVSHHNVPNTPKPNRKYNHLRDSTPGMHQTS